MESLEVNGVEGRLASSQVVVLSKPGSPEIMVYRGCRAVLIPRRRPV